MPTSWQASLATYVAPSPLSIPTLCARVIARFLTALGHTQATGDLRKARSQADIRAVREVIREGGLQLQLGLLVPIMFGTKDVAIDLGPVL